MVTAEGAPPEAGPKAPEAQAENAWNTLAAELLEINRHELYAERTDAARTRVPIAETIVDYFNLFKVLENVDTNLRGRAMGSMAKRGGRMLTNATIGFMATGVDLLDSGVEALNAAGPLGYAAATAWEYIVDSGLNKGANWAGAKLTGKSDYRYASELSHRISTIANVLSIGRQFLNPVNIEAAFRTVGEVPILGVPVEWLYIEGNRFMHTLKTNPRAEWFGGLVTAAVVGYLRGWNKAKPATA